MNILKNSIFHEIDKWVLPYDDMNETYTNNSLDSFHIKSIKFLIWIFLLKIKI